ncbi:conserved hypothetical protein [Dinoroseobacter shibae DFL 12 = DSM 16493]|uniref:DUF306 domain-containing protein n=1 Tax=Dinoroseobacter shibae (strain DSM 16493 / NCIMB 14021 / DFL 12) TaxID=398580 RepID=A8LLX1_DINSH|nr:YbaY family lipoprotein [Dinoroseobacter shibae]ABV94880.1 conserved hypothetical protein [Dinoroseobacter shibae DFL 12 = DSM 16493]URF46301.1 YbaY family lipoprotein [Dinoroseobacter shibae]URF50607.1 YbaY family lipoprotein [Dinoroseobacter shibae]
MGRLMAMLVLLATVIAVPDRAPAETATLEVTVGYRERIALPPGAQLEVELLDTSLMDVAATRIASQRVVMTGVPMSLSLPYDPAVIDPRMTYTVSARLFSGREVIFRSTQAYPVLTRGAGSEVEITLEQARRAVPEPTLTGTLWTVTEVDGAPARLPRPPTLELTEDGAAAVFAGCNRLAGRAEIGPGTLSFPGPMAGTMMACPEPESLWERDMIAALEAVRRYEMEGEMLRLLDADGAVRIRLRP